MLCSLLQERVASPLCVQSLREDLEVARNTVRRWLDFLAELFCADEVKPFAGRIARSLRKEGKLYLRDWSEFEATGPRVENLLAGHLAKACDFWTDSGKGAFKLRYVRDKQKREIDFVILNNNAPWVAIEAKLSDCEPSPHFRAFARYLGDIPLLHSSPRRPLLAAAAVVCWLQTPHTYSPICRDSGLELTAAGGG